MVNPAFPKNQMVGVFNLELARKIDSMEDKYDEQFLIVFDAIKQLLDDSAVNHQKKKQMGFHL